MDYPNKHRPISSTVLIALLVFYGILGLISGALLISDPSGASLGFTPDIRDKVPFQSFLPVGLFLFLVYGLGSLTIAYGALARKELIFGGISKTCRISLVLGRWDGDDPGPGDMAGGGGEPYRSGLAGDELYGHHRGRDIRHAAPAVDDGILPNSQVTDGAGLTGSRVEEYNPGSERAGPGRPFLAVYVRSRIRAGSRTYAIKEVFRACRDRSSDPEPCPGLLHLDHDHHVDCERKRESGDRADSLAGPCPC